MSLVEDDQDSHLYRGTRFSNAEVKDTREMEAMSPHSKASTIFQGGRQSHGNITASAKEFIEKECSPLHYLHSHK